MRIALAAIGCTAALALTAGCRPSESPRDDGAETKPAASVPDAKPSAPQAPDDAGQVRPLKVGDRAPSVTLRRPDGEPAELAGLYREKPTVLVFYRGGWCPYCTAHLAQLAAAEPELLKLGYQVVAVSPDRPEELAKTLGKHKLSYTLLSDSDAAFALAFGLAFRVDDPTIEKYRGFGIDLEKASGMDHHLLPVPAVYIVDTAGVIRFAHWEADYKQRLAPEALRKRAEALADTLKAASLR
jgi:peroxiredoxin